MEIPYIYPPSPPLHWPAAAGQPLTLAMPGPSDKAPFKFLTQNQKTGLCPARLALRQCFWRRERVAARLSRRLATGSEPVRPRVGKR